MTADTPRPERVTLTAEERERIKAALNADWDASECDTVHNLAEAVERILAARESALRAQIKAEVPEGPSCGVASRGHDGCYKGAKK